MHFIFLLWDIARVCIHFYFLTIGHCYFCVVIQYNCLPASLSLNFQAAFLLYTVLLQLFKATEYLVKYNILHCDLKLENVLLYCLCSSSIVLTGLSPAELSALSRDPKVVCDVSKAEVWAVGLMAYETVTGKSATKTLPYDQN